MDSSHEHNNIGMCFRFEYRLQGEKWQSKKLLQLLTFKDRDIGRRSYNGSRDEREKVKAKTIQPCQKGWEEMGYKASDL